MTGPTGRELRFSVRLTPRAGTDRVDGVVDGVLRARVAAPPVDEAANQALVRLLARELGVAVRDVRLAGGQRSRVKLVAVAAIDLDRVRARWPGLVP